MTGDDIGHDDTGSGDEFWGSTPDWSTSTGRPRRDRAVGRGDVTGAIKGWWNVAMSGGVEGTREHRIVDETAPAPLPNHQALDSTIFDDLDDEIPLSPSGRVEVFEAADPHRFEPTTEVPVIAADVEPPAPGDESEAITPLPMLERDDSEPASRRAIDPLLARVGAVAVVTTLLVPLMIGLTSGDDGADSVASAPLPSATSVDTQASAPEGAPTNETVALDPDLLPPAVPVDSSRPDDPSTSAEVGASSTSFTTDVAVERAADEATGPSVASDASTVTATAVPVETPASAEEDAERINCARDYEVRVGDYWLRLADGAGVPLDEILEANGATTNTPLYPGVTICLPAGASTPPPPPPPTTAAPTTAAPTTSTTSTTTTTVAPTPAGPEEVRQIIRDVWPDDLEERALEIAYRESRFDPTAKNFCCYGIFQIYWNVHRGWLGDMGITNDQQLFDPATNARAAYALYQRAGGWGPWGF